MSRAYLEDTKERIAKKVTPPYIYSSERRRAEGLVTFTPNTFALENRLALAE